MTVNRKKDVAALENAVGRTLRYYGTHEHATIVIC
jgi:hypothetical protein